MLALLDDQVRRDRAASGAHGGRLTDRKAPPRNGNTEDVRNRRFTFAQVEILGDLPTCCALCDIHMGPRRTWRIDYRCAAEGWASFRGVHEAGGDGRCGDSALSLRSDGSV